MLTRILFCTLALLLSHTTFSQIDLTPKEHNRSVWSAAYFAGPFYSFKEEFGYEVSLEGSYRESLDNKEFVFNITSGNIPRSKSSYTSLIEVSVGPRFFFGKNQTFFAEGNIGGAVEGKTWLYIDYFFGEQYSRTTSKASFYLAAGIGGRLSLLDVNYFLYRLKFHTNVPYSEGTTHITAQFGFQFSDRESKEVQKRSSSKLSFSLVGGINNPITGNKFDSKGEFSAGVESTLRSSAKIEWSMLALYNKFQNYIGDPGIMEISFSPRFYLSRYALTAFFESGAGLYLQTVTIDTEYDNLQPGISFGAGILGNFAEHFGIFVRGRLNLLLTDNPDFPFYTNLLGGVRYNL